MIEKDKIPGPILKEMFELFGEEKTERIVNGEKYNYIAFVWRIQDEKFKRRFGFRLFPIFIVAMIIVFTISIYLTTKY